MVPTAEARITRQMLYSALPLTGIAFARLAILSPVGLPRVGLAAIKLAPVKRSGRNSTGSPLADNEAYRAATGAKAHLAETLVILWMLMLCKCGRSLRKNGLPAQIAPWRDVHIRDDRGCQDVDRDVDGGLVEHGREFVIQRHANQGTLT